jgi:hypothetical protein
MASAAGVAHAGHRQVEPLTTLLGHGTRLLVLEQSTKTDAKPMNAALY